MSDLDEIHFRLRIQEEQTGRELFQKYSLKQILAGAANDSLYFRAIAADRFTEKYDHDNAPIYSGDIVKSFYTSLYFTIVYEYGKHIGRPLKNKSNIHISDISTTDMTCYVVVGNTYTKNDFVNNEDTPEPHSP